MGGEKDHEGDMWRVRETTRGLSGRVRKTMREIVKLK